MILVMSRAMKNLGDYLIFERGKALVENVLDDSGFEAGLAYKKLSEQRVKPNEVSLIIVPGGPGISNNLQKTYPFISEAIKNGVPIAFLGVGSNFFPGNSGCWKKAFKGETLDLLGRISKILPIGVRDYITYESLHFNGITNIQMNGCPAWYDLNILKNGGEKSASGVIERIVFTPPANPMYMYQAEELLGHIRRKFPNSSILVSFHRGIDKDSLTSPKEADLNLWFSNRAESLNCEIYDASYSIEKIKKYDAYDLHVGYRVHAHVHFISQRKPSFLVCEDSRGIGMLQSLGGGGVHGWSAKSLKHRRLLSLIRYKSYFLSTRLLVGSSEEICDSFDLFVDSEMLSGFQITERAWNNIVFYYENRMKPFIEDLRQFTK